MTAVCHPEVERLTLLLNEQQQIDPKSKDGDEKRRLSSGLTELMCRVLEKENNCRIVLLDPTGELMLPSDGDIYNSFGTLTGTMEVKVRFYDSYFFWRQPAHAGRSKWLDAKEKCVGRPLNYHIIYLTRDAIILDWFLIRNGVIHWEPPWKPVKGWKDADKTRPIEREVILLDFEKAINRRRLTPERLEKAIGPPVDILPPIRQLSQTSSIQLDLFSRL